MRNFSIKWCIVPFLLIMLLALSACVDPVIIEHSVAWNPHTNIIAVVGSDLRLYSEPFKTAIILEKMGSSSQVTWSPDGDYLIVVGKGINVWDTKANKIIASMMNQSYFASVAWSPDGSKIAVGSTSKDKSVRIFNGKTFSLITSLVSHEDQINSVTWSPDSSKLASGSYDGAVIIWEATTGKKIGTFQLPKGDAVTSVAWSPNGQKFAVGSLHQTVQFLNVNTWQLDIQRSIASDPGLVYSIAWSPDGKRIAITCANKIKIWDVTTGQLFITLQVSNMSIDSVSWSSDGTKIATAGKDNTLRVWNAITGEVIASNSLN